MFCAKADMSDHAIVQRWVYESQVPFPALLCLSLLLLHVVLM